MKKRPLGRTGIEVSEVAFGGVEIGMPYGIGAENNTLLPEEEAIYLLHSAVDRGINFFDTARVYGQSESVMGKAFKERRDQVVIGTKCGHILDKDRNIPQYKELKKIIEKSLKLSLKALQTDYVDLFMLHEVNMEVLQNEDVSSIFSELKQSGIVRTTGVSTYTPEETEKAIKTGVWDVIQLPFNLLDQRQEALFPAALDKGVGIVVRSVLMRGLLSDRGKNLHPALKEIEMNIERFRGLLSESVPDLPTLATKFPLSFDEVSSILVGIDRMEYLDGALEAANGEYMDAKTFQAAKALAYPNPDFINLHNWNIKGWLK